MFFIVMLNKRNWYIIVFVFFFEMIFKNFEMYIVEIIEIKGFLVRFFWKSNFVKSGFSCLIGYLLNIFVIVLIVFFGLFGVCKKFLVFVVGIRYLW